MSKHTPGPWTADDGEGYSGWRIRSQAGTLIAEVVGDSYASDCNARLIAAAPDLLAALKSAVEDGIVTSSSAADGGAAQYSKQAQVADQIRAAIAAAEGEE